MTDYGHPVTFGLSLYPSVELLEQNRELTRVADGAGLEYIAIQDHAYNPEFLDVWTLITHLAAQTERIAFVLDVADLQLRQPAMLAKAAASLSVLSGGRIVLGVGGGASAEGIAAMGGARRSPHEMVEFTEEALAVMREALATGVVERSGSQLAVDYEAGPDPMAPVPLWLGSTGRRMLAVTGRSSDGWVSPLSTYVPPAAVPAKQQRIDEAARAAGRDPAAVRRIYNVVGAIGGQFGRGPGLSGDVASWVATLSEWTVDLGLDTFILWPTTAPQSQLEIFAAEVIPGVRQRVAERRAST
jgi:alkanesulfonate monooxygenase SsuD/methylene tetrahydromethanopterin reductase-like flavin-dependent oxidoreductase (luciferase family)